MSWLLFLYSFTTNSLFFVGNLHTLFVPTFSTYLSLSVLFMLFCMLSWICLGIDLLFILLGSHKTEDKFLFSVLVFQPLSFSIFCISHFISCQNFLRHILDILSFYPSYLFSFVSSTSLSLCVNLD